MLKKHEYHDLHFIDKEPEAQRAYQTYLGCHIAFLSLGSGTQTKIF